MNAVDHKLFFERGNPDGTQDLLCLSCRALVGENLSHRNLSAAQSAHKCRRGLTPFGFKRPELKLWKSISSPQRAEG